MKKRGPKPKLDQPLSVKIQIPLMPELAEEITKQAQAAGYDWPGGTADYARVCLLLGLKQQKTQTAGAADPYAANKP